MYANNQIFLTFFKKFFKKQYKSLVYNGILIKNALVAEYH